MSAIELELFEHLGSDGRSFEDLSSISGVVPEKLNILMGALQELGLVEINESTGEYRSTEMSLMYLNPDSPAYLGSSLRYAREMFPLWNNLEERLTSNQKMSSTPTKGDTPSFLEGMHARAFMLKPAVMPLLNIQVNDSVLDVAAGAGTWSLFVQKEFQVGEMTLLEQPEIHDDMKAFITAKGLESADFIKSDYHAWQSDKQWDRVLYFGALHQEEVEQVQGVLEKLWSWVKPGGSLTILDVFYADADENSLFAYLFGLNMMLTTNGSVFGLEKTVSNLNLLDAVQEVATHRLRGEMPYYLLEARKRSG